MDADPCGPAAAPERDLAGAYNRFGCQLVRLGRAKAAVAAFERALALRPDYATAHSNLLHALCYCSEIGAAELFAAHLRWDDRHGRKLLRQDLFDDISRDPERRLRVGYMSPYFREHPPGYVLEPLLAEHDHRQVEVFCYTDVRRPDAATGRFRAYADHWTDIAGWGMQAVAERIRADRIDLLVDLAGHFGKSRLEVFARKPAPVQLTGIYYPNSTGLSAIDYRIGDTTTDPGGAEAFCSERLLRLPRSYVCYRPHPDAGPVMPSPANQSGHVTFGSLNRLAKLTSEIVALWARVLRAVPASRLVLKAAAVGDLATRRRTFAAFAGHGISPDRLQLETYTSTPGHFRSYDEIDIALDPFPYNGAVTSLEALWMGVPLVALRGDRHAARVGASLLTAIGHPELIAESLEEYVGIAVALAGNLARLAELRAGLRERMRASPLCDGAGFARVVENAYRAVWRRWCSGEAMPLVAEIADHKTRSSDDA